MADHSKQISDKPAKSFDLQIVYDSFAKCSEDLNALDMDHYLAGFKELYRFFRLLGTVFSFVSSDIISKVNILEEYRKSPNGEQYKTLHSMIEFELSNGIITNASHPSGSRTLLRLHRALEFIMYFMRDMGQAPADAETSVIARKCYDVSLSKYHPWLMQKGVHLAMYSLPARQQFIEKVLGGSCSAENVCHYEKLMGDIAAISKVVHQETEQLYKCKNLLNLP